MTISKKSNCFLARSSIRCQKLTSNSNALVQIIASTAPEENSDGALGRGLPSEINSLAGLGVQAGGGDVERVGSVGVLSESEKGRGGDGQEGGCGETHVDVDVVGVVKMIKG
jgi:hypothetical protein